MDEQIQPLGDNLDQQKTGFDKPLNIIEEMLTAKGISVNKPKDKIPDIVNSSLREDYQIKLSQMCEEELTEIERLKTEIKNNNNNGDLVN